MAASSLGNIIDVSDATFDAQVLKSQTPVLVDFWAPWCAPCKAIAPVLEDVAKEFSGQLIIAKINVDDNPQSPTQYGVRGIPNLVIFKGGQVIKQIVGAVPKDQLVTAVKSAI
jgi:thioredoxin 1